MRKLTIAAVAASLVSSDAMASASVPRWVTVSAISFGPLPLIRKRFTR